MPNDSFYEVLTAAINDLAENGFDSIERVARWTAALRAAAERSLISPVALEQMLRDGLAAIYRRMVEQEGLVRYNPGVGRFTIEQVKPKLRAELERRIFASADLIKLNRKQSIDDTIRRFQGWATSVPAGGSDVAKKRETKDAVKRGLASLPFEERRVLIDQGHKLTSAINEIVATDGGAIAAEWRHHHVTYPRPEHVRRDGDVFLIRGSWAHKRGFVKPGRPGYTDDVEKPGELVFCFPGTTQIQFADGVEKAYRRRYSGELTEIVTASGKTLRATPNHPVLTPHGFVPIGSLNKGDDLVEITDDGILPIMSERDANYTEPTIAQIFASVSESGLLRSEVSLRDQFHGDGCSDGYVDIVTTALPLLFDHQTMLAESKSKPILAMADQLRFRFSSAQQLFLRCLRSATGIMRSFRQPLSTSFAFAGHADHVGLRTVPELESKMPAERGPRHSDSDRYAEQAFPFAVRETRIVNVERRQWAGHVFNLQTNTGWYVANGIIAHNCRCTYTYLYHLRELPPDMLTRKGAAELDRVRAEIAAA